MNFKKYAVKRAVTTGVILATLLKLSTYVSASSAAESAASPREIPTSAIFMIAAGAILIVGSLISLVIRNIKNKDKGNSSPLLEQKKRK